MGKVQDQIDYLRGEFTAKMAVKASSDNFINTQSDLRGSLSEPENIYSYMDMKIQNLHAFLDDDFTQKIQK
jgi:hypothetical protein